MLRREAIYLDKDLIYTSEEIGLICIKTLKYFFASSGFKDAYISDAVVDSECPTKMISVLFVTREMYFANVE